MATVADKSGNNPTDKSFVNPNRSGAGEPNGSVTPQFAGERYLDTTTNMIWQAINLTNTSWVAVTAPA